jgi:arylsulfatase
VLKNTFLLYGAQAGAAQFADTFKEFPPIQKPNTFTIDDAINAMGDAAGGAS